MDRPPRHYGMDWLRIAAFALLILYHVGMVFAPWHWVIKSPVTHPALIAPMAVLTPWRLPLLFAVSGYASAKLFAKAGGARAFFMSRSVRLLVPLAFGMTMLVPAEMWVQVRQFGYPHGYPAFWIHDYWRVGMFWHLRFPSWEHLWFVAYLWAYSAFVAGLLALGASGAIAPVAGWLGRGRRLFWVPTAGLVVVKLLLLFVVAEDHGLTTDWSGHAEYLPIFLFGFVLASDPRLWLAVARAVPIALAVAILSGATVAWIEVSFPADAVPPHALAALGRGARMAMAWSMVLVLFAAAERWLNRDHRWRAPLARAVFPAYLLHHTALIVAAYWTLPLGLGASSEFALLLSIVLAACWLGYVAARRAGPLGALLGLPPRPARRTAAVSARRVTATG